MALPRVREPHVLAPSQKPIATQAQWDDIVNNLTWGFWTWDGVSIEAAAARIRFPFTPPPRSSASGRTWLEQPVNGNWSSATRSLLASYKTAFEHYDPTCSHCAALGNPHCFGVRASAFTECVLCWADGQICTYGQPIRTPAQVRKEAVLRLVGAAPDHAWAVRVFDEYQSAEVVDLALVDEEFCFRSKKPEYHE